MSLKKVPLSLLFYALSDPARLEIIRGLMKEDEVSCGSCKSDLSKSTMSHHFKVLREAGFIQRREEGKVHFISLRQKEIEKRLPGLLEILKSAGKPLGLGFGLAEILEASSRVSDVFLVSVL